MCNYNFDLPVDPMVLIPIVKQKIEENGGVVTGEVPSVSVTIPTVIGEVGANARLVGPTVVYIEVTKMPPMVTCAQVREKLVEYLTEALKTYQRQLKAAKQQEKPAAT